MSAVVLLTLCRGFVESFVIESEFETRFAELDLTLLATVRIRRNLGEFLRHLTNRSHRVGALRVAPRGGAADEVDAIERFAYMLVGQARTPTGV